MTQVYTPEQMKSAEQMARTIGSVPLDTRSAFRMMIDAMLVGATITHPAAPDQTRPGA
ncbi:MAG: hypothetical protein IJT94_12305 [Oscillibacter sp.]|nr:hypothetical protein [Oscillibacter sp.]